MKNLRVLFMGTPDFAVPTLKMLTENANVVGVVTQPDKPKGRGHKLAASPVKIFANEKNIPVYQPEKVKDDAFFEELTKLNPDIIVVVAFGQILPKRILDFPKYGCINVHASLLPKYRGAAPIEYSIINGEEKTGITTMYMDVGLDTGDMLLTSEVKINEDTTADELRESLKEIGAKVLKKTLEDILSGEIKRIAQDDALSGYAPMITKETGKIDWNKSSKEIHNLVRGLNSTSVAYTKLNDEVFKIWRTKLIKETVNFTNNLPENGEIIRTDNEGILVKTGDNVILITELQTAGKKKMFAKDFLRGNKINLPAKFV